MSNWKVYIIKNSVNSKGYVGITAQPPNVRLEKHFQDAYPGRKTKHGRICALHAAIQKYGDKSFSISKLEDALSLKEARFREKHYIKKYNTYAGFRRGYNLTFGGEMPDPGKDIYSDPSKGIPGDSSKEIHKDSSKRVHKDSSKWVHKDSGRGIYQTLSYSKDNNQILWISIITLTILLILLG